MAQVTWRAPDESVERVRQTGLQEGRSLNEDLTRPARAATDPALAASDVERLRERLAHAGLLAPHGERRRRPGKSEVAAARRRAGHGTPLADLVTESRR